MDIATSFTCFKWQYYTRMSYVFFYSREPRKTRVNKFRKNVDKQGKIRLQKQILSSSQQKQ